RQQKLEIVAEGNTGFDQDGNWRFVIDSSGNLDLDKRESGSWVNKHTWTSFPRTPTHPLGASRMARPQNGDFAGLISHPAQPIRRRGTYPRLSLHRRYHNYSQYLLMGMGSPAAGPSKKTQSPTIGS
ncbi:MAG: hypothetical protein ACOC8C_01165, partial [Chloroflexota bacterium]